MSHKPRGRTVAVLDIYNLATDLFDGNGCLRDYHHGTFGLETNDGNLIYILDVDLKKHLHNQGHGCQAVRQLLDKLNQRAAHTRPPLAANETSWSFAVLWPDTCEASWRPAGFRRIAHARYLGCCRDPQHACWDQTAPDIPWPALQVDLPECDRRLRHAVQGLPDAAPEHAAAKRGAIIDLMRVCAAFNGGANVARCGAMQYAVAMGNMEVLLLLIQLSGLNVNELDEFGNAPLHVAALGKNMAAVRLLLAAGADPLVLNSKGANVPESLYREMLCHREFQDSVLRGFTGHSQENVQWHGYLRALAAAAPGGPAAGLRTLFSQWGCTCGQCLGGWLSPRMLYRLDWCCDYYGDTMHEQFPDDDAHVMTRHEFCWLAMGEFLPTHLRHQLRRPMLMGFAKCLRGMAVLLHAQPPQLPTATALSALLTSGLTRLGRYPFSAHHHQAYLDAGGRVEYAIAAVVAHMRDVSEAAGDGDFNDMTGECADVEMASLPLCANDDDYHLAMRQLNDAGFQPAWGPFHADKYMIAWEGDGDGDGTGGAAAA